MPQSRAVASAASHQRRAEAAPAGAAMDEHLGQVGAVRLVLGLGEHELDGADDAGVVLGDQQRAPPRSHVVGDAAPELLRPLRLEGMEEADARVAVDRVDEDARERRDLGVVDRVEPADPVVRARGSPAASGRMIADSCIEPQSYPAGLPLDIFLYRNIMIAWHEQRRRLMRSTRSPSHGGGRSWISSPAGSVP